MARRTDEELREDLELAMSEFRKILKDPEATPNQKTYAGSNLAGLIKQYREQFGSEESDKSKLRSVKNF